MKTIDQVISSQKSNLDNIFSISQKTFDSFERIAELNISTSKNILDKFYQDSQAILSVKNPQEILELQTKLMKESTQEALVYTTHIFDSAKEANQDLVKNLESQSLETQKEISDIIHNIAKNAPLGSEPVVELMKTSMNFSTNFAESIRESLNQASEAFESSIKTMVNTSASENKKKRA